MPNTITLPNGEWDAVYVFDLRGWRGETRESSKDSVRIAQEGNQFVGMKLIGDEWLGKNQETVKGELEKNRFREVHAFTYSRIEKRVISVPGKGKISEDGNRIVIKARPDAYSWMRIVLKRK